MFGLSPPEEIAASPAMLTQHGCARERSSLTNGHLLRLVAISENRLWKKEGSTSMFQWMYVFYEQFTDFVVNCGKIVNTMFYSKVCSPIGTKSVPHD